MYKQCKPNLQNNLPASSVIRIVDGACIPFDPDNSDYQTYLRWLDGYESVNGEWTKTAESNTPEEQA